jgi:hypothetical protein
MRTNHRGAGRVPGNEPAPAAEVVADGQFDLVTPIQGQERKMAIDYF